MKLTLKSKRIPERDLSLIAKIREKHESVRDFVARTTMEMAALWSKVTDETRDLYYSVADKEVVALLKNLERVHKREMMPELAETRAQGSMRVAKLPLSTQKKLVREGVPVVVEVAGELQERRVPPNALSGSQVAVAFETREDGSVRLRTRQEQADIVKERVGGASSEPGDVVKKGVYRIARNPKGDPKVFPLGSRVKNGLSRRDMERAIRDMDLMSEE